MASGSGNYGDDLGRRFADEYGDSRSNNRPPQTKEEYYEQLHNSQTHRCTWLAVDYYNENHDVSLSNVDPYDSQAFDCSWTAPGDKRRCFHVTFKAKVGSNETQFFFAEITGNGAPHVVRNCVMLGGPSSWSTNICMCCSGMWHPKARGSFDFGRK